MKNKRLGEVMVDAGVISRAQLDEVLEEQRNYGGKLGNLLFDRCWITEPDYLARLSVHLGIPAIDFTEYTIPNEVMKLIPRNVAWEHVVVPVGVKDRDGDQELLLAMADPVNLEIIDVIKKLTGLRVRPGLALEAAIRQVLMDFYDERYGEGDYRLGSRVEASACAEDLELEPGRVNEPEAPPVFIGSAVEEEKVLEKVEVVENIDEVLFSDRLSEEHDNFSLELQAFLLLLIKKGLISSGEYMATLKELKLKRYEAQSEPETARV